MRGAAPPHLPPRHRPLPPQRQTLRRPRLAGRARRPPRPGRQGRLVRRAGPRRRGWPEIRHRRRRWRWPRRRPVCYAVAFWRRMECGRKKKKGGVRELDAAFCSFHPLSSSTPPNLDSFAAARGGGELEIHGAGERVAGEGGIVVRVVFLSLVCCYIFLMLLASPLLSFPRPRAQREHAHTHTHTHKRTPKTRHTHTIQKR